MIRFTFKLILCLLFAVVASFVFLSVRSGDPVYTLYEWVSPARFQRYDPLIRSVAAEHHLDPMLVKAVVWRESRFDPQKYGTAGERGLMQVSENAANEWARENKVGNFIVEELFDPKTNLQAGCMVSGASTRTLGGAARPGAVCARRIQRRREPGSTLGRRRRERADLNETVSVEY